MNDAIDAGTEHRGCLGLGDRRAWQKPWLSPMRTRNGEEPSMLSPQELERYARHIVLHEIGGPGQQALKRARVLVIGAGGVGGPALLFLAAAGGGTPRGIGDRAVAPSDLPRPGVPRTPQHRQAPQDNAAA